MPSIINSDDGVVSGTSGLKTTGGNDGILALQNNGTTNVTVTAAGNVGIGTSSPINVLTVQTAATGTTAGSNIIARLQSNASGRDATLQFSDNVANSATISMVGGAVAVAQNGVERTRIDTSGNFQFNSGYGSVATAYGCRAWVNFNGTGTVAIRASGNVSSITDNGTGDYTVNFTTAMPDGSYSGVVSTSPQYAADRRCGAGIASDGNAGNVNPTTTQFRFETFGGANATVDPTFVCVAIFR